LEKAQAARFVEDELLIYFNSLVHFTKQTTQMTAALEENVNAPKPQLNPGKILIFVKVNKGSYLDLDRFQKRKYCVMALKIFLPNIQYY